MKWDIEFLDEAKKERDALDGSVRIQVYATIHKVSKNPVAKSEGGYGTPLGHKRGLNLTGLFKIKLLKLGIRIVYMLVKEGNKMKIVVIAARADDEVYEIASRRIK